MKKLVLFVIVPVFIGGIFCYSAAFAEHTGPDKYNNEDLEKFETPGNIVEKTAPNVSDKKSNEKKIEEGETHDKEYWCRQGTPLLRTISDIKIEIDRLLDKYPEKKGQDIDKIELPDDSPLKAELDMNKRKLREAEGALSDFEDQARRKGVPLGWIRCNFE